MPTVLLVDDELDNLLPLKSVFEANGYSVQLATNGKEALDKLACCFRGLIVSDWEMPVMDGLDLCRQVRSRPTTRELPIILLSALPEPADGPPCGCVYFRKPANLDVLVQSASRLIAHHMYLAIAAPAGRWQGVDARCWP
ncbi:response regulator (plasmid) [Paraburkholderia sp. PGU19]|uniref:response regulator n=1 Tax=Paraburkholderia sp. PGU19 TaxID=2735434 RepID=UPI0015DACA62|nr:response regulator [Paraburkholderia sp. PGU19]BCG05427.1 response regulator [Paraburkholderia sp. PGU19]